MMSMKRFKNLTIIKIDRTCGHIIPDCVYLRAQYELEMGRKLTLKEPRLLTEKIQWLKLYDRNPAYTSKVDKVSAKEIAARIMGRDAIIPTIKIVDRVSELDMDTLPEQFVMKCTHDSGSIEICYDRKTFDWNAAIAHLDACVKHNHFWNSREWVYKNAVPRIMVEEYLDMGNSFFDYEILCFNGKAEIIMLFTYEGVDYSEKPHATYCDFYDRNWNKLDYGLQGRKRHTEVMQRPGALEYLLSSADQMAAGTKFLRCDFFEAHGKIYFGEMTFFTHAGYIKFQNEDTDAILGKMLKL